MTEDLLSGLLLTLLLGPIFALVFFSMGVFFRVLGGKTRLQYAYAEAQAVRIAEVRSGTVKVRGNVQPGPGGTVRSPLTGKECVLYRIQLTHFTGKTAQGHTVTDLEVGDSRPFSVTDGSGTIVVDPKGALLVGVEDPIANDSGLPFDDRIMGWLRSHGVGKVHRRSPRLEEFRLEVGRDVGARGPVDAAAGLRGGTGDNRLVLSTDRPGYKRVKPFAAKLDRIAFGLGCLSLVVAVLAVAGIGAMFWAVSEGHMEDVRFDGARDEAQPAAPLPKP